MWKAEPRATSFSNSLMAHSLGISAIQIIACGETFQQWVLGGSSGSNIWPPPQYTCVYYFVVEVLQYWIFCALKPSWRDPTPVWLSWKQAGLKTPSSLVCKANFCFVLFTLANAPPDWWSVKWICYLAVCFGSSWKQVSASPLPWLQSQMSLHTLLLALEFLLKF